MKKIMKKIKGFTLIELIAVVILLGIIGLITYPTVTGVINDSKEKAYNTQISMVEEAGKRWGIDNTDKLSENKNVLLQIDDLIKNGYINKTKNGELIDPRTNEKLEGCIIISYSSSYKQYEYKYDTECTPVEDTTPPSIAMNVANGVVNSNGWATSKFYVNVNGDHLTSYKYCVSNAECEPDTVVSGNSGNIYISISGINYVCVKGINTVGSTETICKQYKLEENQPEIVLSTNSGIVNASGWAKNKFYVNVSGSHLLEYDYCVSNNRCTPNTTVSSDGGSIYVSTAGINYVCVKGKNAIGTTDVICERYGLDEAELTFVVDTNDGASVDSCSDEHVILDISITSANLSGIDHYEYAYRIKDSTSEYITGTTTDSHIALDVMSNSSYDPYGAYEFIVKAYDTAGKVASKSFSVQLEWVCFVAGTKVYTENGYKSIETVEIGDKVWTIDVDTNELVLNKVTDTILSTTKDLYHITINDEIVSASPRHSFYVLDKGWVRAYELKVGDIVMSNNQEYVITDIEHQELAEPITVYNLTVENNHNYLVTKYSVLVHNAYLPSPCLDDPDVPLLDVDDITE